MGTVIKAGEVGAIKRRLAAVDLSDHLAEANSVIERAHREAEHITAAAREETRIALERARAEGHGAGYREGHAEGTEAGRREAFESSTRRFDQEQAQLVTALAQAMKSLESMKEDLLIAAERDVLSFAVRLARRLTFDIGRLHDEAARENFRRALGAVSARTDVTVLVHPQDRATIETFASELTALGSQTRHVSIREDAALAPGGCRVQAGATRVDASLETQIADLTALLLGEEATRD